MANSKDRMIRKLLKTGSLPRGLTDCLTTHHITILVVLGIHERTPIYNTRNPQTVSVTT